MGRLPELTDGEPLAPNAVRLEPAALVPDVMLEEENPTLLAPDVLLAEENPALLIPDVLLAEEKPTLLDAVPAMFEAVEEKLLVFSIETPASAKPRPPCLLPTPPCGEGPALFPDNAGSELLDTLLAFTIVAENKL